MSISKRYGQFILGILISLAAIAGIGLLIDPHDILSVLATANLLEVILGASAIVLYMFLRVVRWQYLLNNTVSLWQLFHIQNIGYMLTQLLPFRVGDVARAVLVGRQEQATTSQGILTMGVERMLDMLLMLLLLPLTLHKVPALPAWMQNAAWSSAVLLATAVFILILIIKYRPVVLRITSHILSFAPFLDKAVWQQRLDNLLTDLSSLLTWRKWLTLVLLTLITWGPIIVAYTRIMRAVKLQPTWETAVFVMCVGAFSVAAPSSPGQIGVFHAGVTAAMALLGQPVAQSAALALLYHAVNFMVMLLLGIVALLVMNVEYSHIFVSMRAFVQKPSQKLSAS